MTQYDWQHALADLHRWHLDRSAVAGRQALVFIEPELRLAVPPLVRRTWPPELVEDAIRDFLTRLLDRPLPEDINDPHKYLVRAFRNRCIDIHRARQRRNETPIPPDTNWPDSSAPGAETVMEQRQRANTVSRALDQLSMTDRVALKVVDAPEWLTDDELTWLGRRCGQPTALVRVAVRHAEDVYDLTLLFDPAEDDPSDPKARRHRMERFRRRRGRARDKLRVLLTKEGTS